MNEPLHAASSLASLANQFQTASQDGAVNIREVQTSVQIALRGNPDDPAFRQATEQALTCALPLKACSTCRTPDGHKVLWLGPDDWLFVSETATNPGTIKIVTDALAPFHASAVDVSMARLIIALSGRDARNVLEKMCLHDLHPRAFGPGRVVGTVMFKTQVLLEQIDDRPTYHIYVRPSFARHLAGLIMDAMVEYTQERLSTSI